MLDFQLFRAKVYPPKQLGLFVPPASPAEVLRQAIESLPSVELRQGITWHIGNLAKLDDHGVYFRVGRISKATLEVYQNGSFQDAEFETAPYTHVVVDVRLGVCAIARKARLSQTTQGIANQLARLFDRSETGKKHEASFELDPISDPENLISYLARATSVEKFWVTFKRPNPWDVNGDFIQPMQKLLNGSHASRGKTEIEGTDLAVKCLEELARSAAATGDEAVARMSLDPEKPTVRKNLRGNPVIVHQPDLMAASQLAELLAAVRTSYAKVRGPGSGA